MRLRACLAAAAVLAAAASTHTAPAPRPAATVEIVIEAIAFAEAKTPLHVGDTIVWVNKDVVAHTATATNKDWRVVIPPNAKATLVLERAGEVSYYCEYHPNMTGKLVIRARKR